MACAAVKTSLRQNASQAQDQRVENPGKRFDARMNVVRDTKLLASTRLLYVLLDDYARSCGVAWPSQKRMAADLGYSEIWVRKGIQELVDAKYIETFRRQRGVRYRLCYASPTDTPISPRIPTDIGVSVGGIPENPDRYSGFGPTDTGVSVTYKVVESRQETEKTLCPNCGGAGEREYSAISKQGKERRWTGPCGCQQVNC